ncbi:unnamed protein product [Cylindrotheca closterium]|uniref:Uncharacterized protein n=1 Tax=Cylindrotheca closterium TaxID=2856 RepID=A0AAD2FF23_9STRA|nr:unnamed protein product [Cylindrotheca closterium]
MYAKKRPPTPVVAKISSWSVVQHCTAIQVGLASITFGIAQVATWGYVFPALIAMFVPFRIHVVSRFFSKEDLEYLDPVEDSDEDYSDEQRELHKVDRDVDKAEVIHGFSELRMKDVDHNASEYYDHHPDVAETVLRNRQRSITS